MHRRVPFQRLHEGDPPLQLAHPRPLGQVAGDADDVGPDPGDEVLQGGDLLQVGVAPEVEVAEVDDGDLVHQVALIR